MNRENHIESMGHSSLFCKMGYRTQTSWGPFQTWSPHTNWSWEYLLPSGYISLHEGHFLFHFPERNTTGGIFPVVGPEQLTWWGKLDKKWGGLIHSPVTCGFSSIFLPALLMLHGRRRSLREALNSLQFKEEEIGSLFMTKPSPLVDFC